MKLVIEIEIDSGFKNPAESFDFIHHKMPCFNYDNTGIVTDGGEVIGGWKVVDEKSEALERWTILTRNPGLVWTMERGEMTNEVATKTKKPRDKSVWILLDGEDQSIIEVFANRVKAETSQRQAMRARPLASQYLKVERWKVTL
jgi:hypothetical protein